MPKSPYGRIEEPKAAQIQRATHNEILSVGQHVFQAEIDQREESFQRILTEKINEVVTNCEQDKQDALLQLKEEHMRSIKKVKEDAIKLQDTALKAEAKRVEAIMKKVATQLVEEKVLEGQKKLEEALIRARENFDVEKQETIRMTIRQQERIALQAKEAEDQVHRKNIEKLNVEWEGKIKDALDSMQTRMHGEMVVALQDQRVANKAEREQEIRALNDRHALDIADWQREVKSREERNDQLVAQLQEASEKHEKLEERIHDILGSFQSFVDSVPGFSGEEGQSDFLLHGLVPDLTRFGITTEKFR